jgi:hypothetical protein
MPPNDTDDTKPTSCGDDGGTDPFTAGDSLLNRARDVARKIVEKVSRLTGDNQLDPGPQAQPPGEAAS